MGDFQLNGVMDTMERSEVENLITSTVLLFLIGTALVSSYSIYFLFFTLPEIVTGVGQLISPDPFR